MKVKVYAKLNLSLNVVGSNCGYHLLDALTTSIDIFDVVSVNLRNDGQVLVSGVDIPLEQNVAYKASKQFFSVFGGNGCDISIEKNIPFSQGLGGSSADASATIYCLAKLCGVSLLDLRLKKVCDSVGSDVWFMLKGGCGIIVERSQVKQLPPIEVYGCLITFAHQSNTASVFNQYDVAPVTASVDNDLLYKCMQSGDIKRANDLCFNALQEPSRQLSTYADDFINYCQKQGVKPTMTGSGSAYFVLCTDRLQAQSLAQLLCDAGFCARQFDSTPRGIEEL